MHFYYQPLYCSVVWHFCNVTDARDIGHDIGNVKRINSFTVHRASKV